ncbi:ADP-ribose pyrophosphatase, mitochondrial [Cloeon dipterum]|uniref:ADP-ribose pyrophosphatase, mitochondrial n=1 Tax=Cloeon dipterum TaxID=197152 RepID=UPI00321FED82
MQFRPLIAQIPHSIGRKVQAPARTAAAVRMLASTSGMSHTKCRSEFYARTNNTVRRFPVPLGKVNWEVPYPEYKPTHYTSEHVLKSPPWADKEDLASASYKWNDLDNGVNRRSYLGQYKLDDKGRPLNPIGRTGVQGRGCLGRWGPNHAADPIVTKWKRDSQGHQVLGPDDLPILQCVLILRGDCNEWALPGGMVDPGEHVSKTLQREFLEEAMDSCSEEEISKIKSFFESEGSEIYKGYVDDPRNTDNSWMETYAMNFHDHDGSVFEKIQLQFGDDAVGVKWRDLTKDLKLYASHSEFIDILLDLHINSKYL